jgi:hypothetical protein
MGSNAESACQSYNDIDCIAKELKSATHKNKIKRLVMMLAKLTKGKSSGKRAQEALALACKDEKNQKVCNKKRVKKALLRKVK